MIDMKNDITLQQGDCLELLKRLDSLGFIETLKVKTDKNVLKYNYKVKGL